MNPTDIKLNAKNTQVYVADNGLGQFITIDYQTGAVVSSVSIPGIQSAVKPPNAINK
jgi:DNA-binding beta-propeller fold protein YncE